MSSTRTNGWRRSALFRWHLYSGMAAALLVVALALSGIALNHGHALGLDRRFVTATWILDAYGLPAPRMHAFELPHGTLVQAGEQLYLDEQRWPDVEQPLIGAFATDELVLLAEPRALWLLTASGELIEKSPPPPELRGEMLRLGATAEGAPVIAGATQRWVGDPWQGTWRPLPDATAVRWSAAQPVPAQRREALRRAYHARSITFERVLLDLHSGRVLGAAGPWLMDAAALALILQVISGIWLWGRRVGRL